MTLTYYKQMLGIKPMIAPTIVNPQFIDFTHAIDTMDWDAKCELLQQVTNAGLPIVRNLAYDYKSQKWIG